MKELIENIDGIHTTEMDIERIKFNKEGQKSMMKYKKTFIHPETSKEWWIEAENQTIRTCLNNRKVKEIICDSDYAVKNKASQEMMGKMRKGFVYQNPDAAFGEARCHRFVGRGYNGFLPIAASLAREDFYVTRIVGDFEDELLYHFDENGTVLETISLGEKRMTYGQVLCANNTILMNNSYLIEQFSMENGEITPFANQRNSFKTMLDAKEELALWYTGEEIVVFDFKHGKKVWSEAVECQATGTSVKSYYCEGLLSPQQTKAAYRTEERGYVIVDLKSAEKILIENDGWHPFFSPDDQFFCVGGECYFCETGKSVRNPFPFKIKSKLTYYDTCTVKTNGRLIAFLQSSGGMAPIELWDYNEKKLLTKIEDLFTVKNAFFEFTKSNLVLHTDYGAVSVYDCRL